MDLDLDMSIPDRNVELETKLLNQYYNEFVDNYISKIVKLDSHPDFIRDDSFNGIKSSEHIIYKLRTNETGATHLLSRDGNRGYEFVIEFDKREPAYGIYYGCKGLIFGGDQEREINTFLEEWKSIRKEVSYILNNTFPEKISLIGISRPIMQTIKHTGHSGFLCMRRRMSLRLLQGL